MTQDGQPQRYSLGDVTLSCGAVLPQAEIVYATYGTLNEARDNCILMPTYYHGIHNSYAPWIGPGRALDPAKWFIVVPNAFCNGYSTSPSHGLGADFPEISVADNVRCQYQLLTEHLGVKKIKLAVAWSMGATQSLHFAAAFPSMVANVLACCGTANTWPLNKVFLEGLKATVTADGDFAGGRYTHPPLRGVGAIGKAFAGWVFSAAFYRNGLFKHLGVETQNELLEAWATEHQKRDANDLLALMNTWNSADIGATVGHPEDLAAGLGAIQARCIIMPCDKDAFYTSEEAEIEAALISLAELRPLTSPYGHCAGLPGAFPEEGAIIDQTIKEILAA